MKKLNQKTKILNHFFKRNGLTQVEAAEVYKIRRLSARISELKKEHWNIVSELKKDMEGQRYAKYRLLRPYKIF